MFRFVFVCCSFFLVLLFLVPGAALAETAPAPDIDRCEGVPTPNVFPKDGQIGVSVDINIVVQVESTLWEECRHLYAEGLALFVDAEMKSVKGKALTPQHHDSKYVYLAFQPEGPLLPNTKYTLSLGSRFPSTTFTTDPVGPMPVAPTLSLKILKASYQELSGGSARCVVSFEVKAPDAPDESWIHIRSKTIPASQDPFAFIRFSYSGSAMASGKVGSYGSFSDEEGTFCQKEEICLTALYQGVDGAWDGEVSACLKPVFTPLPPPLPPEPPTIDDEEKPIGVEPIAEKPNDAEKPKDGGSQPDAGAKIDGGVDVRVGCGCSQARSPGVSFVWLGFLVLCLIPRRKHRV